MKEKIVYYLCSWKFCFHMNILFLLGNLILSITDLHAAYVGGVVYHFGFGFMTWALANYETRYQQDQLSIRFLDKLAAGAIHEYNRYKALYGELPEETPESEKQNSEEPNESDK